MLFVISSPGLLLGKATVLEFIFSVVEIEKLYVVLGLLSTIVSILAGLPIPWKLNFFKSKFNAVFVSPEI